mmetsp:Transcript_8226/g.34364  ORF Transcript_8226/g.34364 Transcript_8226/m.34364 type:complete len:281 (-) Transcript_8226:839-1681(-)
MHRGAPNPLTFFEARLFFEPSAGDPNMFPSRSHSLTGAVLSVDPLAMRRAWPCATSDVSVWRWEFVRRLPRRLSASSLCCAPSVPNSLCGKPKASAVWKGLAAFRKSQNFISPSAAPVTTRFPTFPGWSRMATAGARCVCTTESRRAGVLKSKLITAPSSAPAMSSAPSATRHVPGDCVCRDSKQSSRVMSHTRSRGTGRVSPLAYRHPLSCCQTTAARERGRCAWDDTKLPEVAFPAFRAPLKVKRVGADVSKAALPAPSEGCGNARSAATRDSWPGHA